MSASLFYFSSFLGIGIFTYFFYETKVKRFQTFSFVPFIGLIFISTIVELLIYSKLFKIGSVIWFRTYGILEFFTLFYFFLKLLRGYRVFFSLSFISYLFVFVLLLLERITISALKADAYLISIETIFVFTSIILWFMQVFKDANTASLSILPEFFFVSGLILFFSGTLTLELLSNSIFIKSKSDFLVYWNLMSVCNIILRLLILAGLWKKSHQ